MLRSMPDFAGAKTKQGHYSSNCATLTLPVNTRCSFLHHCQTAIEKCDTKSFWHGFTESHLKIFFVIFQLFDETVIK